MTHLLSNKYIRLGFTVLVAALLLIIASKGYIAFLRARILSTERIALAAVDLSSVTGEYIIAYQENGLFGPDWVRTDGEHPGRCNVVGDDLPYKYINYDFAMASNCYVLYLEREPASYHDPALDREVFTYHVSGWDVLAPVSHDQLSPFRDRAVPDYLLESDLNSAEHIDTYFGGGIKR